MIVEILVLVFTLCLIDYWFVRDRDYREVRFFWPGLAGLNVVFILLVLSNLIFLKKATYRKIGSGLFIVSFPSSVEFLLLT